MRCLLVLTSVIVASTGGAQQLRIGGRIAIAPTRDILLGDEMHVRLKGLQPGLEYQFTVESTNEWGVRSRSVNTFAAGLDGVVDPARDAPARGSYVGADRLGMFWSATRVGAVPNVGALDAPADSVLLTLTLRQRGRTLDSTTVVQRLRLAGSTVRELREHGIVGALYDPPGSRSRPMVVILGGSGGGMTWQRTTAALLSAQGYSALALAYFGAGDLPAALSNIPLEYVRTAIGLAARLSGGDSTRVAVIGLSRGAEMALLVGAAFPEVTAVVAYAPSHVAFMGQRPPEFPLEPAWTLRGQPVPYVPTREIRPFRPSDNESERQLRYLAADPTRSLAAAIPVESIRGPVLLFAGNADPIWPSLLMADLIIERLSTRGFRYEARRFAYDSAGHAFARPGYGSTVPTGINGGDARANAYAQVDSWQRLLAFLDQWRRAR